MPPEPASKSHFISLEKAKRMIAEYCKEKERILSPEYRNKDILPTCEKFDRADFDTVLSNPECVALRIYYGMDDELKVHAIIVGVNRDNQDILPGDAHAKHQTGIIEDSIRCPTECPHPSLLNP